MREKITHYIRAGYAGLYLVSHEEQRVEAELKAIATALKHRLYAWSATAGLIDTAIFENEFLTWRGTAADLETLIRDSKYSREADRLFRFNTACGVYLARLHEQDPHRFKKTKSSGKVKWAISPPQKPTALD